MQNIHLCGARNMIFIIDMAIYKKSPDLSKSLKFGANTMQINKTQNEMMEAPIRNAWIWGFTPQAELWNGRLAMIGFGSALLIELFTNQGLLRFWGLLSTNTIPTP